MIVVNKIAFVFLIFPIAFAVKSQKKRDPKDYKWVKNFEGRYLLDFLIE